MTDKLDLAEEIAALRRALAANSTMLKQTMMNLEALDGWGQEANRRIVKLEEDVAQPHARLEALEQWRSAMSTPAENPCCAARYQPANDNEPCSAPPRHPPDEYSQQIGDLKNQKACLIADIAELIQRQKMGIVSGDIWELITALDTVLCRYRVDERA